MSTYLQTVQEQLNLLPGTKISITCSTGFSLGSVTRWQYIVGEGKALVYSDDREEDCVIQASHIVMIKRA